MDEVAPSGVALRQRYMRSARVDAIEAAEGLIVGAQHDFVRSGKLDADAIVREGSIRVEVEHEHMTVPLEADDFVALVGPSHVSRIAVQPTVLFLGQVHRTIELVQEFVLQGLIIWKEIDEARDEAKH